MSSHTVDPTLPATATDLALDIYRRHDPQRFERLVDAYGAGCAAALMALAIDLLEAWYPRTAGGGQ
jgi:hypothetical protein